MLLLCIENVCEKIGFAKSWMALRRLGASGPASSLASLIHSLHLLCNWIRGWLTIGTCNWIVCLSALQRGVDLKQLQVHHSLASFTHSLHLLCSWVRGQQQGFALVAQLGGKPFPLQVPLVETW